jgi:hypothetical protein
MEPQNRRMNNLASLAIYADEPAAHPPPHYAALLVQTFERMIKD